MLLEVGGAALRCARGGPRESAAAASRSAEAKRSAFGFFCHFLLGKFSKGLELKKKKK